MGNLLAPGSVGLIQVVDYHKTYRDLTAVAGLTFEVASGAILGLVGPNGAGKTTTLRALAGIIPPTRGRLIIAGHDVVADPVAAKRQLAYVPDDPQLFDALTVGEHLRFSAAAYQLQDIQDQAAELLHYFELSDKVDTPAEELSRGMRQKLGICCAYLHNPSAILFDEPFTGLDPQAIRQLTESVSRRAEQGAAIIVSSHLLAMVEDLCTHFLILSHGKMTFSGTHQELFERFKSQGDDTTLEDIYFRVTDLAEEAAYGANETSAQKTAHA